MCGKRDGAARAAWRACSGCAGDYEEPDRSAGRDDDPEDDGDEESSSAEETKHGAISRKTQMDENEFPAVEQ